jgi:hypothetical protein
VRLITRIVVYVVGAVAFVALMAAMVNTAQH